MVATMNYYVIPGVKPIASIDVIIKSNHVIKQFIIRQIKDIMGISGNKIKSSNRIKIVCQARHLLHFILRENTGMTLKEIARTTNNTYSSVFSGLKSIKSDLRYDRYINHVYVKISTELNQFINQSID